ncbi:MAG: hypothetical protein U9R17_17440 [Thermodesulfobacteriota bacterium]|nr:hypothetical protein [Thermodesulfobacteriota bacterium]
MKKPLSLMLTISSLFSILFLFISGCATVSSLMPSISSNNEWPRKRVMVMPANNLTNLSLDESTDISSDLTRALKNTGLFNIYHQNESKKYNFLNPENTSNLEFFKPFSDMGMNVIIFTTLHPIEKTNVRSGIWPFRKKSQKFTVIVNIDLFDVYRETVMLSKEIIRDITLPLEDLTGIEGNLLDAENKKSVLRKCLPAILKKSVKAICHSLNNKIWEGKIASVDKKTITINAGRDAGLKTGAVLVVFEKGELITAFKGKVYELTGKEVGKIKIVQLKQRYSLAEPIAGTDFKPGQVIRVKQ